MACCSSVQFSHSVMYNSLRPHGLQHTRLHKLQSLLKLTFIESVMACNILILCHPFSSCLQSFPASGSFPMSQFFASGGQNIGASASVLPMNIQDQFPLEWSGLISLQSKGLSRVLSSTKILKHQVFDAQPFLMSNSHICTQLLEKPYLGLDRCLL